MSVLSHAKHAQLCLVVLQPHPLEAHALRHPRYLTASAPTGRSRAERARRRLGGALRQGGCGRRPRDGGVGGGQDSGRRGPRGRGVPGGRRPLWVRASALQSIGVQPMLRATLGPPGRPLAQPACQSVWLMSLAYALGAARLQPAPGSLRTRPCWHCTSRAQSWLRTTSNRVQCLSPALPLCSVWSCAALSSHSTSVVAHMPVGFCDRLPGSAAVLDAAMNNWTLRRAASARTCFHLGSARCLPVRCRRPESRQRRAAPGRPRTPTCSCARARCALRCVSCTTRPSSTRWARVACNCTATARRAQTPWARPMKWPVLRLQPHIGARRRLRAPEEF